MSEDNYMETNEGPMPLEHPTFTSRRDVNPAVLYIGIDLGTSRTVISASNGVREVVDSCVGFVTDPVSKKRLGKDVLFGKEAWENRLSVDFYRPLQEGVIKFSETKSGATQDEIDGNLAAVKALIHHVVSLATPEETLVYAVIGCPAEASKFNKKAIVDAAREVVDSVVVCSEPFTVAYGLQEFQNALIIDIGAGTTDLCRMSGGVPTEEDQVTLTEAGDHVDEILKNLLAEGCPGARYSDNMVKELKEGHGFVTNSEEPVTAVFPVNGRPTEFLVTDEVRDACRELIDPIVEAACFLIGSYDPEFQPALRNNVLLAGGGSKIHGLDRAIEEALVEFGGGKVRCVQEPVFAGANGALQIAKDMPADDWK